MDINKEHAIEAKAFTYLAGRLDTLQKDILKTVQRELDRKQEILDKKDLYANEEEAQEAYGYGYITEAQYDDYRDYLKDKAGFLERITEESMRATAANILRGIISNLNLQARDLERENM